MPGMRRKVTFIKLKIFRSERRRRRRSYTNIQNERDIEKLEKIQLGTDHLT
jgi:hypothetical protein